MKKKHLQPLTPAALYARVSSDRQDVDLSVSAQLRALKEYAKANGYSVTREYVDEAESGRVADRPQFREMIEEGSKPQAPFEVILVWKFSRFTRKREHAVAFKSQLRRKGIRVISITEQADDTVTGRLLEGIIESVDEFYSESLAEEVVRGMREAASRGFFLGSKAPFGYRKVKVQDGAKERPSLEVDPATAPVVKEIFEKSLMGNGLKELCKELNDRGITNRGKRWYKGGLHYVLRNEAYTGAAVWGKTSKDGQAADPVRVEGAWPALVSKELFDEVQQAMSERAPKVQRPGRVGSQYLLSGLLKCGVCGRPYSAQGAKSGQFAYYICGTLFREGAGTCSARYLNAPKLETFVVEKIRERILNEETIVALVQLVAEEIDAMAGELSDRLEVVEAELSDVRKRLGKLYEAIETSELTLEVLSPRIMSLRHREEQLEAAREDAETRLEQRRVALPGTEEIVEYVADFQEFLKDGTIPEKKALIRNFVEGIEVAGDEATLTYTVPMPRDGVRRESASVLDFVQSGPPPPTKNRRKSGAMPGLRVLPGHRGIAPAPYFPGHLVRPEQVHYRHEPPSHRPSRREALSLDIQGLQVLRRPVGPHAERNYQSDMRDQQKSADGALPVVVCKQLLVCNGLPVDHPLQQVNLCQRGTERHYDGDDQHAKEGQSPIGAGPGRLVYAPGCAVEYRRTYGRTGGSGVGADLGRLPAVAAKPVAGGRKLVAAVAAVSWRVGHLEDALGPSAIVAPQTSSHPQQTPGELLPDTEIALPRL